MKMTRLKKLLQFSVCIVLIAAIALFASGCGGNKNDDTLSSGGNSLSQTDAIVLGEGNLKFRFSIVGANGDETEYEIHTNKETVGEALLELGLIAGDIGNFGLYVKTVDGVTLDYDTDGLYWAFYENGVYAAKGVDSTEITEGASYAFKAEK